MVRWQDRFDDEAVSGAVESGPAWQLVASRLRGQVGRVAVVARGAERGAVALREAGLEAVAFEADEGTDGVLAALERGSLESFDALALVDVLGRSPDDLNVVRALSRRAVAGTRLLGAVLRAEVGQQLDASRRRAYGSESIDALMVRGGWSAPRFVGRTAQLLVFECTRVEDGRTAEALAAVEDVKDARSAGALAEQLATAANATEEPGEARELLLALGALHQARGESESAEQAFTAANAIAPTCARPVVALAALALARGESDNAEAMFDHSLAADATNADAWRGLATIFEARGETGRAIESLECAASLAPSDAALALALSRLHASRGDAPSAAAVLERVLPYAESAERVSSSYCWLVASSRSSAVASERAESGARRAVFASWSSSATQGLSS